MNLTKLQNTAYNFLKNEMSPEERIRLESELHFWNRHNAQLQIKSGDRYRIIQNENDISLMSILDPQRAQGGYLTAHNEPVQRIDYTQHCVSTYLQTLSEMWRTSNRPAAYAAGRLIPTRKGQGTVIEGKWRQFRDLPQPQWAMLPSR